MKKTIKAKWVKALTSGKYRQANGVLRSSSGAYCCLGVLRIVMHPGSRLEDADEFILHPEHAEEAGLDKRQQRKLAELNDNGKTFKDIAAYIDKRL